MYVPGSLPHPRSPFFRKPWVRVRNGSGETIPPHSVMRITSWNTSSRTSYYTVAKPDGTFRRNYLVNGPIAIGSRSTSEGWATFLHEGGLAQWNVTGSMFVGQEVGPKSGLWSLSGSGYGFVCDSTGTISATYGTGALLACRQQIIRAVFGRLASAGLQNGGSATVTVTGSDSGGSGDPASTGQTISSVYNQGRYIYKTTGTVFDPVIVEWIGSSPVMRPLDGSCAIRVKPDSNIVGFASGNASIWTNDGADTGDDVSVYNAGTDTIDSGHFFYPVFNVRDGYVIPG